MRPPRRAFLTLSLSGLVACSGASAGLAPLDANVDHGPPAENTGESCDGRQATLVCPQDCPGVTSGPPNQQYCFVNGICQGPGCP